MANSITSVKCFYVPIGSADFPDSYEWSKPYGFDELEEGEMSGPVYKYSLLDTMKNFISPIQLIRNNPVDNNINSLLVCETDGNEEIKKEDINSPDWDALFKIIHYIYVNQSTWNQPPESESDKYNSLGDQKLSTDPELGVSDNYLTNSIGYTTDAEAGGRFYRVKFRCKIGTVQGVNFTVFFSPDYYIRNGTTANFGVYTYEDLEEPENEITEDEFDKQINEKYHNLLKDGKFKSYKKFKTRKRVGKTYEESGGSTEGTELIEQVFYVFSSLADAKDITDSDMKNAVRKYLIDKYGEDNMGKLIWMYPDLFTTSEVLIVPVYDNKLVQSGSTLEQVKHPFDGVKLLEVINRNNKQVDPSQPGGSYYEIFYVGYMSNNDRYDYRYPLIAFEDNTNSSVQYPISSRFPEYVPIYGQESGQESESQRFHQYLILALNIITGIIDIDDIPPEDKGLEWEYTTSQGSVESKVSFTYRNVRWTVKGQL